MRRMAGCNGQLDTIVEIVTPENIAFQYRVAGPFRRLPAYLIDLLIRAVFVIAAFILLVFGFGVVGLGGMGMGIALVIWFFFSWFYGGLFETFWNGQTPGKRLMRIRVLSTEGQPINGLQAVMRNILRVVDSQPLFFYQAGLFAAAMNDRFQRLGDLACGTMVVVEEPAWKLGLVRVADPEAVRLAEQIPAGFQVTRSLARALAAYVERREQFALARRIEIARRLAGALCERCRLAPDTNPDLLLCAFYYRAFITDRHGAETAEAAPPDDRGFAAAL